MPDKKGRLTTHENALLAAADRGLAPEQAVVAAGYVNVNNGLLKTREGVVGAEFVARELAWAEREAVPLANRRLVQILSDDKLYDRTPRLILQAVEQVYKRHDSLRAVGSHGSGDASELTPAQLRARIDEGRMLIEAMQARLRAEEDGLIEGTSHPVFDFTLLD